MKELIVDFSDEYPHVIYFETTSSWGRTVFLVSENFVSETRTVFLIQRKHFNLNHIINLKQFKVETI